MAHKHGYQKPTKVTDFHVDHVIFQISELPEGGNTFKLVAKDSEGKYSRPLFTGHVGPEMADQFRELAKKVDQLTAKAEFV